MIVPSLEYYRLSRQNCFTPLEAPKSKAKLECGSLVNTVVKKEIILPRQISLLERQTLPDELLPLSVLKGDLCWLRARTSRRSMKLPSRLWANLAEV